MRQGYKADTIIYESDEIILERLAKPGYVSRKKIIELMREARKDQAERIKSELIYQLKQEGEILCGHNMWTGFLEGSNFDFSDL